MEMAPDQIDDFGPEDDGGDYEPQVVGPAPHVPVARETPLIPVADLYSAAPGSTAFQPAPSPAPSPQREMDNPQARQALAEKLMRAAGATRNHPTAARRRGGLYEDLDDGFTDFDRFDDGRDDRAPAEPEGEALEEILAHLEDIREALLSLHDGMADLKRRVNQIGRLLE